MKYISSRDNPTWKRLQGLTSSGRERRKQGASVLDGEHLLVAAFEANARAEAAGLPPVVDFRQFVFAESLLEEPAVEALIGRSRSWSQLCMPTALFRDLSTVESPTGVLAEFVLPASPSLPDWASLAELPSVLVLDGVQDAGNLGTLLRTAAAAGITRVLLGTGCAQVWSPKVLRAGQGAHFLLTLHEQVDLVAVLSAYPGMRCATGFGPTATPVFDVPLSGPVAWLMGAEGQGLSANVAALATHTVTIPMPGAMESLNVAAAAAICLFEQVRQQRAAQRGVRG